MDQFVTTYRRDYLWPYVRSFGKRLIEPEDHYAAEFSKTPKCPCYPPPCQQFSSEPVTFDSNNQDWSRNGPMGTLIEPKLYPVKAGKSPETNTTREDQPNTFLRKLHQKYPYLYEILQTAPSADLVNKVNDDRLRSTYQVDYCHMDETAPDNLLRSGGIVIGGCPETVKLPGDPCPANTKPIAFRPGTISKSGGGGGGGGKGGGSGDKEGDGGSSEGSGVWTFNKTEYQDNISKIGALIIRDRLHYHTKKK